MALDIVGKRAWYFAISGVIVLIGLVSMIIPPGGWASLDSGLRPGIDFTGGSELDISFAESVDRSLVQARMEALGHSEARVQKAGSRSVLIRTSQLKEAVGDEPSERQRIQDDLATTVGPIEGIRFDSISAEVAGETVRNAFLALAAASVFILLYIWYAFRRVPRAYRYGVSAVLALVHDTFIVLGVFSILGRAIGMEVNAMFIVGILTVAGYSVNDTIVVFDRIRENVIRRPDQELGSLVNLSILETLGRSLNTSFTTLLVLLAMLLIGGSSIRELLLVVAIGAVVGTYSSIFIASQFIVIWERGEIGSLLGRGRRGSAAAATGLLHLIGR